MEGGVLKRRVGRFISLSPESCSLQPPCFAALIFSLSPVLPLFLDTVSIAPCTPFPCMIDRERVPERVGVNRKVTLRQAQGGEAAVGLLARSAHANSPHTPFSLSSPSNPSQRIEQSHGRQTHQSVPSSALLHARFAQAKPQDPTRWG